MPTSQDDLELEESYGVFATVAVQTAEKPTFDFVDWENRVQKAAKATSDVRWVLGDLLVEAEPHFLKNPDVNDLNPIQGEGFYVFAEEITGLGNGHLRDLASTADRCPASVRTDKLTWSHHRVLVNNRPKAAGASQAQYEEELKTWLEKAVKERMTVAKFREASAKPGKKPILEKSFLVTVPLCVWEALQEMAADPSDDEDETVDRTVQAFASKKIIEFVESDEGAMTRNVAKKRSTERLHKQQQKNGRRLQRNYPGRHFK